MNRPGQRGKPINPQGRSGAGRRRSASAASNGGMRSALVKPMALLLLLTPMFILGAAAGMPGSLEPNAAASHAPDPQQLFNDNCDRCHQGNVPRAPHLVTFQLLGSDAIHAAMAEGSMREYAKHLSPQARRALADFLGGALGERTPTRMCAPPVQHRTGSAPQLQGWSLTLAGTRFIPDAVAALAAADVPRLRLKWAFAYPGATRARSQPSVAAGAVYVGSQDGAVYALDLGTGCAFWAYQADTEVRSAPSLDDAGETVYFGDIRGNVYAIRAADGELLWRTLAHDHPDVTLTGSPRLHGDRLYVPLSSKEWASAADPAYPRCTFRGGVVAMAAATGEILWTAHSIAEPAREAGVNAIGAKRYAPAGAPVWNSPTIDVKRNRLYVGTGEAYTSPAAPTSDSVLAFDLDSGELLWSHQSLAGDAWNMSCFIGGGPNCPEEDGPDLDIGAPPMLVARPNGKDLIVAGQKSGHVFALDPDANGQLVWKKRIGRGGFAGGVHWGMAAGENRIYAPNADTVFSGRFKGERKPGLFALRPATGETLWFTPASDVCAPEDRPECDPGLSAAVTAIPGVVFAGAFDGHLRAYSADSGKVVWDYDTNRTFETVSGAAAKGGSIESDGPVVVDGHVLVNSGYLFGGRMAGNVLLAFAVGPD